MSKTVTAANQEEALNALQEFVAEHQGHAGSVIGVRIGRGRMTQRYVCHTCEVEMTVEVEA